MAVILRGNVWKTDKYFQVRVVHLTPESIEAVAQRVAEIVIERLRIDGKVTTTGCLLHNDKGTYRLGAL